MDNYTQVVKNIVKLRDDKGYTQEEVASVVGLGRQRWALVEKGERILTLKELEQLANFFNVPVARFFVQPGNIEKFKQMYFRILSHYKANGIPKTKFAKLLYLADFSSFYDTSEPISGVPYVRMDYGPVADPYLRLTDELFDNGMISITPLDNAQMIKSVTSAVSDDLLSESEKKRIDEICELWKDRRTSEIVHFTHEQIPWSVCKDGEYIPYSLIVQENPNHVYQPTT